MSDKPPFTRYRLFSRLSFILLTLACAYAIYYFAYSRYHIYTNDAYVGGNQVILTPQVAGIVTGITADDTDLVVQGRPLIYLDTIDAKLSLERECAHLNQVVREVERLFAKVAELKAEWAMKEALFTRAMQDFEHRAALLDSGSVSLEDFEHALASVEEAMADWERIEYAYLGALAQVQNTTLITHPLVLEAKNRLKMAYVQLQRCTLKAPVTGIVAQRRAQVGSQVHVGDPLLAIIPLDQMWVEANYKEIQLSKVRIGQKVEVRSDLWGSEVPFEGTVVGIGAGTGSVFSILPPQNATGNWIKIVQRIPVRIALKADEIAKYPLRLGMSMETHINVRKETLPEIPSARKEELIYQTDVFSAQEEGAEALIEGIIEEALWDSSN